MSPSAAAAGLWPESLPATRRTWHLAARTADRARNVCSFADPLRCPTASICWMPRDRDGDDSWFANGATSSKSPAGIWTWDRRDGSEYATALRACLDAFSMAYAGGCGAPRRSVEAMPDRAGQADDRGQSGRRWAFAERPWASRTSELWRGLITAGHPGLRELQPAHFALRLKVRFPPALANGTQRARIAGRSRAATAPRPPGRRR